MVVLVLQKERRKLMRGIPPVTSKPSLYSTSADYFIQQQLTALHSNEWYFFPLLQTLFVHQSGNQPRYLTPSIYNFLLI